MLRELVPLYRTVRDEVTTQYDMKDLEKLGLLKMDFLGLATLTTVTNALQLIKEHRGETIEIENIPLDDEKTFELFAKAQMMGVFQFESSGMCDILRRARPSRLEDLIALNALYRPGPMKDIDDFIARKHGLKPVTYEFAELEPILSETYGIVTYQEQVMRIAHDLAGFTLGEVTAAPRHGEERQNSDAGPEGKVRKGCVDKG